MPEPASPSARVVSVPLGGAIDPGCEDALRQLERRGHPVWRARGVGLTVFLPIRCG